MNTVNLLGMDRQWVKAVVTRSAPAAHQLLPPHPTSLASSLQSVGLVPFPRRFLFF